MYSYHGITHTPLVHVTGNFPIKTLVLHNSQQVSVACFPMGIYSVVCDPLHMCTCVQVYQEWLWCRSVVVAQLGPPLSSRLLVCTVHIWSLDESLDSECSSGSARSTTVIQVVCTVHVHVTWMTVVYLSHYYTQNPMIHTRTRCVQCRLHVTRTRCVQWNIVLIWSLDESLDSGTAQV